MQILLGQEDAFCVHSGTVVEKFSFHRFFRLSWSGDILVREKLLFLFRCIYVSKHFS